MMNKLYATILVLGLAGISSACDNKAPAENAAGNVGQVIEQVQESVEQVSEQVSEQAPENLDAVATETTEKMEETK